VKSPSPVGFTQSLSAFGTGGNRAAPLKELKTTIYGLVSHGKYFPTCSASKIAQMKSDSFCPKKALVAQGGVFAQLGAATVPAAAGTACNPYLHVWNAGQGKLTFFFLIIPPKWTCATLSTGASAPYPGTVKNKGKNLVIDVPLPPDVSTQAGGLTGVYSALLNESIKYAKQTTKVKGKKVGYFESVGCKKGKRPWSQLFKAQNFTPPGGTGTQTLSGSAKCS
jgi:hypothetical protein